MAKLTAICVTLIGLLLILPLVWLGFTLGAFLDTWAIPALVLIIGIGKLIRNFKR